MSYKKMAQAARADQVEDLKAAIASIRSVVNFRPFEDPHYPIDTYIAKDQQTALHLAAHHGSLKVLDYLIEQGANIDISDLNSNTPAHMAAIHHQGKALQLLCKSGDNRSLKNNDGLTPEAAGFLVAPCRAISNNDSKLLKTLLTPSQHLYPRRDDQDNDGNTLLHHAVIRDNKDCVRVLIERNVNPLLTNKMGTAPGVLAARRGSVEIARQLHPCFLPANRR